MRFNGLMNPLNEDSSFNKIIYNISENKLPTSIMGLSESGRSYFIDGIYEKNNKSIVIITHSDLEAKNIYEDLLFYTSDVYYFPVKEVVFYNIDAISGDLRWARLNVLKEMMNSKKKIIVTSIDSFTSLYTPKKFYADNHYKLKIGKEIDLNKFNKKLVQAGYERVSTVEGKGEFAVRGGILDIYPPNANYPYRIELFGDEIESIRTFNTESQRSIDEVKKIDIFPAKEIIIDDDALNRGMENIKNELEKVKENKGKTESKIVDKLKSSVNKNLEILKETHSFENIDSYLPFFYEKCDSFFDYIDDYLIVLDDTKRCSGRLNSIYYEFRENFTAFLSRGDILPTQGNLLLSEDEVLEKLKNSKIITMDSIGVDKEFISDAEILEVNQITLHNYHGQLDLLIQDIKEKREKGYRTLILSGTKARGVRLVETLRERGIESSYKEKIEDINLGEVIITYGNLLKGFEYPSIKLCVISDKEVFGESKRRLKKTKPKKKGIAKIKSFTELKLGDYVVHVNHGIGVYKGIKQIEVGGHKRDYLDIGYDKGDKVYVPVEQLDLIQKYVGSEGKQPKINKLGGAEWQKAKIKAKKSINEIAEDLVKLYAARSTLKGYKYSKDTQWQRQFEDEFPYEETPDQLISVEEIKGDMESDKPMDRLLCGDVGYGKTEVALRGAFKAVMDGKQVAFLVPTTILAEQHYKNMKKRFSDFPIKIDMVSRFRTAKEQKETLKATKEGNVDILVGTHRLVSKDIEFKDLGLLIIDEEQRFGVAQKEKMKKLKKNVDVLTLSATPIPRTLHMSLTGVRDISVIETPPEERYPVQTYVVEQNDQLIRDAILREINRGGQVFFIYNRVEDIDVMAEYIRNLVPESRVSVAHGKMNEKALEKEIVDFNNREYDVLICTTIIETGIDMPNVNTMIVYDSDKMGLSQLYQLRGRVGRSNKIAYAYLVYRKDKILTEVAEKRLKALKDFTELGSGFKIAMRDLEIRGAGNMMGSSQHGHMSAVGYDLYCRMLEDTIKLIKGEIDDIPVDTTVDIKVDAYIPDKYITDEMQKIEIYKKIAAIENNDDYEYITEELEDRYSEIPKSVYNLMDIAYIKSKAKLMGVQEIKEKGNEIYFIYESKSKLKKEYCKKLLDSNKERILIEFSDNPYIVFKIKDIRREELLTILKSMLDNIV